MLTAIFLLCLQMAWSQSKEMQVKVPSGTFTSFFKETADKEVKIPSFLMDIYPVTNAEFDSFVHKHPEFRKDRIARIFSDQKYLQHWGGNSLSSQELAKIGRQPVTSVSWFVARKFCAAQGKRLPTIAEWEFAGDVDNPSVLESLLAWYAKTGDAPLENVGSRKGNKFGLHDMHGLIWEWVEDFNSVMISSDSRSKGDRTDGFFCGGGSVNAKDAKAYATFMRYGFRSGLRGDYNIRTLGFRCVSDLPQKGKQL